VAFSLTLYDFVNLGRIAVGTSHSPADWVVKPIDVQARWSIGGETWSEWQSLELSASPTDLYNDSRRLSYWIEPHKAKNMHYVQLRFVCRPELPIGHPYSGQPAWLMVDEIEVRRK
jgi:hypothetical protein